jgi:hypothetical protein
MGTVISMEQLKRMDDMVMRTSGKIIFGGGRMTETSDLDGFDFSSGSFYSPTIIVDIDTEDELWQEEIFGPVVVVRKFQVEYLFLRKRFRVISILMFLPFRTKLKESHWQMHVNTVWDRASGHQISLEHIVSLLRFRLGCAG